MSDEVNTEGVMVARCSWLPRKWQWSVWTPGGILQGGAKSEGDAWRQGREALRVWAQARAMTNREVGQG